MTDEERAWAVRDRLKVHLLSSRTDDEFVADLAQDFAAVRADERRRIVAWLRERSITRREAAALVNAEIIDAVANWIERGEHGS